MTSLPSLDNSRTRFSKTSTRSADEAQLIAARTRNADAVDAMMHAAFVVNSPEGQM